MILAVIQAPNPFLSRPIQRWDPIFSFFMFFFPFFKPCSFSIPNPFPNLNKREHESRKKPYRKTLLAYEQEIQSFRSFVPIQGANDKNEETKQTDKPCQQKTINQATPDHQTMFRKKTNFHQWVNKTQYDHFHRTYSKDQFNHKLWGRYVLENSPDPYKEENKTEKETVDLDNRDLPHKVNTVTE